MKAKGRGLLESLLVLDLADEQGSYCTKLLAGLGATVVKVERLGGDPSRGSHSFFYSNTNKLGIVLDLKTREDKHTVGKLIEQADVLVETTHPGCLKILDWGYRKLHHANPRLIHVSITGFGRTGPKRFYRSCNSVASASGGQMWLSGSPSGPPVKLFGKQSWYTASLYAANAVLLGLRRRKITGKGCQVDLSIQEAVASTLDHVMIDYFHRGEIAGKKRGVYQNEPFTILPCKDGYLQLTISRNWETLIELMQAEGKAGNLLEEKWRLEAYREKHGSHIAEVVERWTRNHTKKELFEIGQAMQLPWAPVHSPLEVLKSPQLNARRFFVSTTQPGTRRKIPVAGLPYQFSKFVPPTPKSVPLLGEHTHQVRNSLNCRTGKHMEARRDSVCSNDSLHSGKILNGLRVVDLTRMASGPYATRILADFGAEVIKVQSRLTALGAEQNDTPYFGAWNRNKRSISLDLSHPEAGQLFLKLVAVSDVVVENFSPRVMENWGLTYERLREVKPDLIMASISAMGQSGPWRNFVGFAPTFHALSGLISATCRFPDKPVDLGHAYGDIITGLYAALAILSSIEHRDAAGRGQYIDISAYEALCTLLGPAFMEAASVGKQGVQSQVQEDCGAALCGCYPCLGDDRWCVIAVFSEEEWQALCRISGCPEMRSVAFSTSARRKRNRLKLDRTIGRWTSGRRAETIVQRLQKAGVAAEVVQNAEDLARDSQLTARRFFVSLEHPVLGKTFSDRSALWPWREKTAGWRAAPLLGEANRYVFVELLGHSDAELHSFIQRGVIR